MGVESLALGPCSVLPSSYADAVSRDREQRAITKNAFHLVASTSGAKWLG